MYRVFFIHSSINGHLSYFLVLATINTAAVNIGDILDRVTSQDLTESGTLDEGLEVTKIIIHYNYINNYRSVLRNVHYILYSLFKREAQNILKRILLKLKKKKHNAWNNSPLT